MSDTQDSTPWLITAPPNTGEVIDRSNAAVWGSDGDLVAEVQSNPAYGVPALDRARLIAAAPDYHEAVGKERLPGFDAIDTLREAVDFIDDKDLREDVRQIADDLENAHDKAEGNQ